MYRNNARFAAYKFRILKINITAVFFLLLGLCCGINAQAQNLHKVSGTVLDTTNTSIPNAIVRLIAGKDTLNSSTDTAGRFVFINLKSSTVSLLVRSIGYLPYNKAYALTTISQVLPSVILKAESNQLNEVVIKGKIVPMRLMKDTVEFNAQAFDVREGDRVEDLLKQLPGMELDKEGNATSEGKALTKIRVNGKDFFTGNVKEFIAKLPANIVSKLQVIDDYGEKANFTGIKSGEPQKILNVVLKPDMNRGRFAKGALSAGTNDRYAVNLGNNFWKESSQLGINADASNTNNGTGINNNINLGADYRKTLNKALVLSGNYNYTYNKSELSQQNYTETANKTSTIFNNSTNESLSKNNNHNFGANLQSTGKDNFLQADIRGTLANSISNALNSSTQSEALTGTQTRTNRQDLLTRSNANQRSPNLNANLMLGRHFKKEGRSLTAGGTFSNSINNNNDDLFNSIGYYDPVSDLKVKDSLLNTIVLTRNRTRGGTANFTYTEPLGNPKDTVAKKNIDFSYVFSLTHTGNDLETNLNNDIGAISRIDSLSNKYTSTFSTHTIGLNYRYVTDKLNYSLGVTGQPNLLTGSYEGREDKIHRSGFNFSPLARVFYKLSPNQMITFNYNGNSVAPDFNQLQPVRDTRNLQNVIIGNPELKAAFNHTASISFRNVNTTNGQTLQVALIGGVVQDRVVSNSIRIVDTLNTFKQETRYLNTDGNYNLGGNYNFSFPLGSKKYNLDFKGGLSYNRQVSFTEGEKNFGKGLNLNQGLAFRMNQKWLRMSSNVNYTYRSNVYSISTLPQNTIQTWMFNLDARTFILRSLTAGVAAAKTINQGYSLAASNPLIVNGYIEKTFFKNRMASLKIEGNDLLNEGNSLNNTISGNVTTETRSNQITRYFLFSLNVRLDSFGG